MTKRQAVVERSTDSVLFDEQFDSAIMGVDACSGRLVYSYEKIADIVMMDNEFSYDETIEWMAQNIVGAIASTGDSPMVVYDIEVMCHD